MKVTSLTFPDGKPVEPDKRYLIALNGFDAQSGGRRYALLSELCAAADAKLTLQDIESRDAVIEFFTEKKVIRAADLAQLDFPRSFPFFDEEMAEKCASRADKVFNY